MKENTKRIASKMLLVFMSVFYLNDFNVYAENIELEEDLIHLEDYSEKYGIKSKVKSINLNFNKKSGIKNLKNIAIFIEFNDRNDITLTDLTTLKKADEVFNSGGVNNAAIGKVPIVSVKEYMKKISYGQLNLDTSFYPNTGTSIVSYVPDKPRSYFMKKTSSNPNGYLPHQQMERERELIEGALSFVKSQLESEFSANELDYDNNGEIDLISFFAEGNYNFGEIEHGGLLWPHKVNGITNFTIAGKKVNTYNLISAGSTERIGVFSKENTAYSVIIHEMLHTFGLPDLYRPSNKSGDPVGVWDIMAKDFSYSPQSITAFYRREQLGFGKRLEIISSGNHTITLSAEDYLNPNNNVAIKIKSPVNNSEYFVAEFRKKDVLEKNIPDTLIDNGGLVLYRINTNSNQWNGNHSSTDEDFLYVFRPNEPSLGAGRGNLERAALSQESGRTHFGKVMGSTSGFDNSTLHFSDGTNSGIVISNVTSGTENTITFDVQVPSISGSGTVEDPYLISTPNDLTLINGNPEAHFKMMSDIDMSGVSGFTALSSFRGVFDGQGHKISNLTIKNDDTYMPAALFQEIDHTRKHKGEVKNLILENINTRNSSGRAATLAGSISGKVENVQVLSGSVESGGSDGAGGLAASTTDLAEITDSYTKVSVSGGGYVGGFIGINNNATIINSYSSGLVRKSNISDVTGGVIGRNDVMKGVSYNTPRNVYFDIGKTKQNESVGAVNIFGFTGNVIGDPKNGGVGISISGDHSIDMGVSNTHTMTITTKPNTTTTGLWESSNEAVATVSSSGVVTGILGGKSDIAYSLDVGRNVMKLNSTITVVPVVVDNPPMIIGAEDIKIKVGDVDRFNNSLLDGVTVEDDNDSGLVPTISGSVGKPAAGSDEIYEIIYSVMDKSNNLTTKVRRVTVTNQLPVISGLNDITIKEGNTCDLRTGVIAWDNEDGDITNSIIIPLDDLTKLSVGTHEIEYSVSDNDGNITKEVRKIIIESESIDIPDSKLRKELNRLLGVVDVNAEITKEQLKSIKGEINLSGKLISNIEGIEHCTNIIDLNISNNSIINIEKLEKLTQLSNLNIANNKISDISSLNNLVNLVSLNIGFNRIKNLDDLSNLLKLRKLEAYQNEISDITGIKNLIELEELYLNNNSKSNKLVDISSIESLVKLKVLRLERNYIKDISVLRNLNVLERVHLNNNSIMDITSLNNKSMLRVVNLKDQLLTITNKEVASKFSIKNPIKNIDGTTLGSIKLNKDGSYNNNKIVWENIEEFDRTLKASFDEDINISGINTRFNGVLTQNITFNSAVAPVISGAEDITIKIGEVDSFDKLAGVTATDDHDTIDTSSIKVTGTIEKPTSGNNLDSILTYEVVDSDGNITTVKRKITVTNQVPIIDGLSELTILERQNIDFTLGVTSTDLEDGDITSKIVMPAIDSTKLEIGTHNVEYSVSDSDGNTTSINRVINVIKSDKPIIHGATDLTIKVGQSFDPLKGISAVDTEDLIITNKIEVSGVVDNSNEGTYNLTYSVSDSDGNSTIVERTITVVSNNAPIIQGANNITLKLSEVDSFNPLYGISVIDDHDTIDNSSIVVSGTVEKPIAGMNKDTVIIYEVTDSDGNITIVERVITVTNQLPVIKGLSEIILKEGKEVDLLLGVTARDYEDGELTDKIITPTIDLKTLSVGTYDIEYSVMDSDNNITTEKRKVTIISNDMPIIEGLEDISIRVGNKFNPLDGITASDNQGGDLTSKIEVIGSVDTDLIGVYELVYKVSDSDGNTIEVRRKVTVVSNNAPIINGVSDIVLKLGEVDRFNPLYGVSVMDDHDIMEASDIKITGIIEKPIPGMNKESVMTYEVTDSDGNTTVLKRTIKVTNQIPTISGIKEIVIKEGQDIDVSSGVTAIDYEDGDLTDKIIIPTIDIKTLSVGTHEIEYSVEDKDGNITIAKRKIVVEKKDEIENIPPSEETKPVLPPIIQEGIDKGIIELVENADNNIIEIEFNDVTKEESDNLLLQLEDLKVNIKEVKNDEDHLIVRLSIKVNSINRISNEDIKEYEVLLKVKKAHTNAFNSVNEFISRNQGKDEENNDDKNPGNTPDKEENNNTNKDETIEVIPNNNGSTSNDSLLGNQEKLPNAGGASSSTVLIKGWILTLLGIAMFRKKNHRY